MTNHGGTASTTEKLCCFACGDTMDKDQPTSSGILCTSCGETVDLPLSSYFLHQYYYRFAD